MSPLSAACFFLCHDHPLSLRLLDQKIRSSLHISQHDFSKPRPVATLARPISFAFPFVVDGLTRGFIRGSEADSEEGSEGGSEEVSDGGFSWGFQRRTLKGFWNGFLTRGVSGFWYEVCLMCFWLWFSVVFKKEGFEAGFAVGSKRFGEELWRGFEGGFGRGGVSRVYWECGVKREQHTKERTNDNKSTKSHGHQKVQR